MSKEELIEETERPRKNPKKLLIIFIVTVIFIAVIFFLIGYFAKSTKPTKCQEDDSQDKEKLYKNIVDQLQAGKIEENLRYIGNYFTQKQSFQKFVLPISCQRTEPRCLSQHFVVLNNFTAHITIQIGFRQAIARRIESTMEFSLSFPKVFLQSLFETHTEGKQEAYVFAFSFLQTALDISVSLLLKNITVIPS